MTTISNQVSYSIHEKYYYQWKLIWNLPLINQDFIFYCILSFWKKCQIKAPIFNFFVHLKNKEKLLSETALKILVISYLVPCEENPYLPRDNRASNSENKAVDLFASVFVSQHLDYGFLVERKKARKKERMKY